MINGGVINGAVVNGVFAERTFDALPVVWVATRYRCYLSDAASILPDLELPISSFQTRMRSAGVSYLSCVIKGIDAYADAIAARGDGALKIWREYELSDGARATYLMADVVFDEMQLYSGGRSGITGSLSGTGNLVPTVSESIQLTNPTYYSLSGGKIRYRCELDPRLRPLDAVTINGDSFTVGEITHIVDVRTTTMEISEA